MEKPSEGGLRSPGLGELMLTSVVYPAAFIKGFLSAVKERLEETRYKRYPRPDINRDAHSLFDAAARLNPNPDSASRTKFAPVRFFANTGGVLTILRSGGSLEQTSIVLFRSPDPPSVGKNSPVPRLPKIAHRRVQTVSFMRRPDWETETNQPMYDMLTRSRMDVLPTDGTNTWSELKTLVDDAYIRPGRRDYYYLGPERPLCQEEARQLIIVLNDQPDPEMF